MRGFESIKELLNFLKQIPLNVINYYYSLMVNTYISVSGFNQYMINSTYL